ncbi:MAG TPA: hypothetical protein EYN91_03555 [Candidatus Melainabacteria bacterium]|nr:hypothetical protein [Candidatus Melainabacteria bacterium]HIN65890.1 hypothetical protein [Candidatus Obscuribacterales bacterium]
MSRRASDTLALIAVFTGTIASLPALAQSDGSKRTVEMRDMSKGRIEMPLKGLFLDRFKAPVSKLEPAVTAKSVSTPAKEVSTPAKEVSSPAKDVPARAHKPALKPQQEKVAPGKVHWHRAIQTAMDASKQSGKPVLLFQMMGHLDDRFC